MSKSSEVVTIIKSKSETPIQNPVRLYDWNFLLAFVSQLFFVVANTLLTHYARWIEFLGGSLTQIGWIMGGGVFVGLVLRPLLGQIITRLGAKSAWGIGYLLFSVSTLANLLLTDLDGSIFLLRSVNILGSAFVFASSLTYISQVAPEERRTEAIGILGVGGFFGMLFGPYLGAIFLGNEDRTREDFQLFFVVATLVNVLPFLLLFLLRDPKLDSHRAKYSFRDFLSTVREFWPGRILIVVFTFGVCMTIPFTFLVNYIDRNQLALASMPAEGYFFIWYAGVGIFFRLAWRRLPERIGSRRVLLMGLSVLTLAALSYQFVSAGNAYLLAIPAALSGLGHSLTFHTMTSLTIESFPKQDRGTASALALMTLDLGILVGSPVLGFLGDWMGFSAIFWSVAMLLIATTVVYLRKF